MSERRGFLRALAAVACAPFVAAKAGLFARIRPDSSGSEPTAADLADFQAGAELRDDYLLLRRAGFPADHVLDRMRPTIVERLGDRAPAVERALRSLA